MTTPNRGYAELSAWQAPDVPFHVNRTFNQVDEDVQTVDDKTTTLGHRVTSAQETADQAVQTSKVAEAYSSTSATAAGAAAQEAGVIRDNLVPRVEAIETIAEVRPGSVTDATMTSVALQPDSDFSAALNAQIVGYAPNKRSLPVSVSEYGASPNATAEENRAAIQAALDAGYSVSFEPHAAYRVSGGVGEGFENAGSGAIKPRSGQTIVGNWAILVLEDFQEALVPIIEITGVDGVQITDLMLDGNRANQNAVGTQDSGMHGVRMYAAKNVTMERMVIRDCYTDGILIRYDRRFAYEIPSENITLTDVECVGNRRQGMSVTAARNLHVTRCKFINTNGTSPQAGVDIEPPKEVPTAVLENLFFTECYFTGNTGWGLIANVSGTMTRLEVVGCTFQGNGLHDVRITGPGDGALFAEDIMFDRNHFKSPQGIFFGLEGFEIRDLKFTRNTVDYDLLLIWVDGLILTDNTFKPGAGSTRVWLAEVIKVATLDRNDIRGGTNGIRIGVGTDASDSSDVTVTRNVVRDMTNRGIWEVGGTVMCRINDNDVAWCEDVGIRLAPRGGQARGNVSRVCTIGLSTGSSTTNTIVADNQSGSTSVTNFDLGGDITQRDNMALAV